METFTLGRSKSGLPTLTENGGGMTNTGNAQIICGPNGEAVKPLFVPRGYANGEHAIFVARVGMHIVLAAHGRWGEECKVYRITAIDEKYAHAELIGEYENGDTTIPAQFEGAYRAALDKSRMYHCRSAVYISE